MTCTRDYQPTWKPQLDDSDPNGSLNCSAYVAAYAIQYATCGVKRPTGETVRALSNEPRPDPSSPGLNLDQLRTVALKFGVKLTIYRGLPFDEFVSMVEDDGMYGVLQVGYEPIRVSRFRGSETFDSGHAMGVPPGFDAMDPLADGRRPGIYRYQGERYPKSLLENAAGSLVIGTRNGRPLTVRGKYGPGYCWAAMTIGHPRAAVSPPVTTDYGRNAMFRADWIKGTSKRIRVPKGTKFYRENSTSSPVVTSAPKAITAEYIGAAGNGMGAVVIHTKGPYSDGVARPSGLYVEKAKGTIYTP